MKLAASFREWLSGSYWRLDAPTDERAIEVSLVTSAPDLGAALRDGTWHLAGQIDAEQLATSREVRGAVAFRLLDQRRIPYRFAFIGDDGQRYEARGQKEWSALAPFESVTLLAASLYDEAGEEMARATLRFDLRADWARWVKGIRAHA
jgi:hypothetical protein